MGMTILQTKYFIGKCLLGKCLLQMQSSWDSVWSDNDYETSGQQRLEGAASLDTRPDKIAIPVGLLRASCMTA